MDLAKKYKTDEEAEDNGAWIDWGDGAKLKIARVGNNNYQRRAQALMKPHRHARDRGTISEEIQTDIVTKCIAETVLVDWEGIEYDGKPIKYSSKNAEKLLNELKDFREDVLLVANDLSNFRATEIEDSSKNSQKSSGGS